MHGPIPYINLKLHHQHLEAEILSAVKGVLDRGDFILGETVSEFESTFAKFCGVNYAIGVNSGTDALILAMRLFGIGAGDEVITPPNSFIGTTSAICLLGATPVFADVGSDRNIDPTLIAEKITKKTKLILPVHLGGHPADMDAINAIAQKHNLGVIDDCAQAVGSTYNGKPVGSLAKLSCFSMHPLKNLNACGDAGIITTNNLSLAQTLRDMRNLGLSDRDTCVRWAGNTRLDTIQAAILLCKIKHLHSVIARRKQIAALYCDLLKDCSGVQLPVEQQNTDTAYHTFVIHAERRDALKAHLLEQDIKTSIHYPKPIHLQPAAHALGYKKGDFPETEKQAENILTLPGFPELTDSQVRYIAESIVKFYARLL